MKLTLLVFVICVGFTAGTLVALALVGINRQIDTRIDPMPPILRAQPREAHRQ